MENTQVLTFNIPGHSGLSAVLTSVENPAAIFVMGHGSGGRLDTPLMQAIATACAKVDIACLRFNYPYSAQDEYQPFTDMPVDPDAILLETIDAALDLGRSIMPRAKIILGGHSMSGLYATYLDTTTSLGIDGLVCLGYPRKDLPERSEHLSQLASPLLVIQGSKDRLGTEQEITEMLWAIDPPAQLDWIKGASHAFTQDNLSREQTSAQIADNIQRFVLKLDERYDL
ncbi:hypothetical protein GCM10007939_08100 [Amylibacter marinus]|uniref:KANL3/Tex30 alpha/beta hydrolase-like domain-containing protein n=1 Tax=Amylibacter marinus TaxID=1475483 RepID=A0ABQ5VSX1_9RHOB|nr:alpha/beta family hydrolase [Amylibacter marinus]GLQ34527.1 hypothetical protein GCM10007939_08100 [Amylibacter marinus]